MDYLKMEKVRLVEEIEALQERISGLERDEARRKRTEEALRESRERLLEAQHVARMGFLDWDLKTNEILHVEGN